MYLLSGLLLITFLIMLLAAQVSAAAVSRSILFQWIGLTTLAYGVTILSILGFFSHLLGPSYFDYIRPDSARYLHEANMFRESVVSIDDLTGTFNNYSATPKFGLSALLAVYGSLIGHISPGSALLLINTTWLLVAGYFCYCVNKILLNAEIRQFPSFVLLALTVFFPLDYYWNALILREPIANILLMASLAASYYSFFGRRGHFSVALCLCLIAALFRAQLGILGSLSLLCIVIANSGLRWSRLFPIVLLFVFSCVQSLKASGFALAEQILAGVQLNGAAGLLRLMNYNIILSYILFWIIIGFSVVFIFIKKRAHIKIRVKWYWLAAAAVGAVFFSAFFLGFQLRMLYPLFLLLKLYMLFIVCSRELKRSRLSTA